MPQLVATHETKPLALFQINSYGIIVDTDSNEVYDPRPIDTVLAEEGWTTEVDTTNVSEAWTQLAGFGAKLVESAPPAQTDRTWRVPARVQVEAALGSTHLARRVRTAQGVSASDITEMASTWDGIEGRAWAHRVARRNGITLAALEDVIDDTSDWIDPNQPHVFIPNDDVEEDSCGLCAKNYVDEVHAYGSGDGIEQTPTEDELVDVVTSAPDEDQFDYDPESDYFGVRTDDKSTDVNALLELTPDGTWKEWDGSAWIDAYAPVAPLLLIELDQESVNAVATGLQKGDDVITLSNYANPEEYAMFLAAATEEDWEFIDRIFGTYSPAARSSDAQDQVRDGGGHFTPPAADPADTPLPEATGVKARLSTGHELLTDANARIDQYIDFVGQDRSLEPTTLSTVTAAASGESTVTPENSENAPLYLAIVDSVDTQAVMDMLAIVPGPADNVHDVSVYIRKDKTWQPAPDQLVALRSATPPPVVELNANEAQSTLEQIDAYADASGGKQADGPAPDAAPAPDPVAASALVELGELQTLLWGPNGEIMSMVAAAGVDTHPGSAERLRQYWEHGEGGAKIRWNTPGDWTRCYRHLEKFMGKRAAGYCSLMHHRTTGTWPGDKVNREQ